MKRELSEWAAIAEIVAAVGVILSLIFVGLQINEGNKETRAATMQAALDGEAFFVATVLNHVGTWQKIVTGAPLESGEEMRTAILLYNLLMTENENRFHQFYSGYLDSQAWQARLNTLKALAKLPIYETWRQSVGAQGHSADFLGLVDSLAENTTDE
jgi:hypothetical protein